MCDVGLFPSDTERASPKITACVSCRRMQSHRNEEGRAEAASHSGERTIHVRPTDNQTSSIVVHTPFGRGGKEEAWEDLLGQ
jgi:hypothetical protein